MSGRRVSVGTERLLNHWPGPRFASFVRFVLGSLIAVVVSGCLDDENGGMMTVVEVTRDLVQDPTVWRATSERGDAGASAGAISPALHFGKDGAGMPSLIMPPPCEVVLELEGEGLPAFLNARVGIDVSSVRFLSDQRTDVTIEFEVLVNDEPMFSEQVRLESIAGQPVGSTWVDVAPLRDQLLRQGDVVTLRTFAIDTDGQRFVPPVPIVAGFGGLTLERTRGLDRTKSSGGAPNVVLVVMDTLRLDRLSTYGYSRETSPRLQELAERGTLFESAYTTSSWTWPSTASILTGLYPKEHGVLDKYACFLSGEIRTLAEELQQAGFTTAAWSGNPLVSPLRNFDQGFETFGFREDFVGTETFFGDVESWLGAQGDNRFFLYLHCVEPHEPYVPSAAGRERFAPRVSESLAERFVDHTRSLQQGAGHAPDGALLTSAVVTEEEQRGYSDLYDACVWSGDQWLGRLLDTLDALQLTEKTIVIFTNDHGEELFDHGLTGHGHSLHAELVRAPLVFAGPGIPAGKRISEPVSNRHVASTIVALVGRRGASFGGDVNLLKADRSERQAVLVETATGWWKGKRNQQLYGLRQGELMLHFAPSSTGWSQGSGVAPTQWQLFDTASDPGELRDLAGARAPDARVLKRDLLRLLERLPGRAPAAGTGAGGAMIGLLQQLGYVGED